MISDLINADYANVQPIKKDNQILSPLRKFGLFMIANGTLISIIGNKSFIAGDTNEPITALSDHSLLSSPG